MAVDEPGRLQRTKPNGRRRYLLVVRAGDDSLHRNWIAAAEQRNFDLLVSYYGAIPDKFGNDGDFYHVLSGPRWTAHHKILRDNQWLRDAYDYVCFACDDLDADTATWNALFISCANHGFDLAQPAILGPVSYAITAPVPHVRYRLTTFVENMCPAFSRRALSICYPSFAESVSGWGLNHVWPKLLAKHRGTLAIIDSVRVTHTRALREGSLYTLLANLGIDPLAEKLSIMGKHGIEQDDIRELRRVHSTVLHAVLHRITRRGMRLQNLKKATDV